jgi:hypothetical protein
MTSTEGIGCAAARDVLIEVALHGRTDTIMAPAAKEHIDRCAACRSYARGLSVIRPAFAAGPPLYTPTLRRRTLAAVAGAGARTPIGTLLAALVPAAAAGIVVSFVLPVWLSGRLLAALLPTGRLPALAALLVCTLGGLLAAASGVAAFIALRTGGPAAAPHPSRVGIG